MRFNSWESYFYPETYDPRTKYGTLRNLFDERDSQVLHELEYRLTAFRQQELLTGSAVVPRTWDAAHVRGIHHYLFQDVYEWAGEYRTVDMAKGVGCLFALVGNGEISRYLTDIRQMVTQTSWGQLDHEQFVQRMAAVFAHLNQAHPFREGNGRSSKVFMDQVSQQSRWRLDFRRVERELWNEASMRSRPGEREYAPRVEALVSVFHEITIPRPVTATRPASDDRVLVRASYPQPPAQALKSPSSAAQQLYRAEQRGPSGREGIER